MDVVTLGELLVDLFPAELGRPLAEVSAFRPKPGGAPANVAVAAARLGVRSAFIGKVGDDAFGHHLAGILKAEGVDVRGVRYDAEARTGLAFIAMPDANNYEILFYRNPGADMRLQPGDLDQGLLQAAGALHFGSLSLVQEPSRSATLAAVEIARGAGALISFDVNYRDDLWSPQQARNRVLSTLPHVDLLKVNEREAEILTGTSDPLHSSWQLLENGPSICVITFGPGGSYYQLGSSGGHVPGFQVEAVDATGCGDAFIAALLSRLASGGNWRDRLSGEQLQEALRYANAAGALTSLTQGVIPALPRAAAVEAFLAQNPA